MVKRVFPYGAVEIRDPRNDNVFKVNGHRLKPFLDGFRKESEVVLLDDPDYDN